MFDYREWKDTIKKQFDKIEIIQNPANFNDITVDAGNNIEVGCEVKLPNSLIDIESINAQVFYGKIATNGVVDDIKIDDMNYLGEEDGKHRFTAKIALKSGGDYGYTFRVIPKNNMILNPMNLNLIKWITD